VNIYIDPKFIREFHSATQNKLELKSPKMTDHMIDSRAFEFRQSNTASQ
jgi:hypothetical protein